MSVKSLAVAFFFGGLTAVPAAAGELRGTADVIDGATMIVGGHAVRLADIVVPALGSDCVWNGQPLDCGKLARAGLKDITAGAQVTCTPAGTDAYRCRDGGFDLAFGLIHAGWAVAAKSAPRHYHEKMQEAEKHKRALWSAHVLRGTKPYALILRH